MTDHERIIKLLCDPFKEPECYTLQQICAHCLVDETIVVSVLDSLKRQGDICSGSLPNSPELFFDSRLVRHLQPGPPRDHDLSELEGI